MCVFTMAFVDAALESGATLMQAAEGLDVIIQFMSANQRPRR